MTADRDDEAGPDRPGWRGRLAVLRRMLRLRREGRRFALDARRDRVRPTDPAPIKVVGSMPLRVLLVGGEYAVGYGVAERAEALDGHLARLLHERTGRGVVVANASRTDVRLGELAASLGSVGAHTYDLVVWAPSFAEAGRLRTVRPWRAGVTAMVERIRETSSAGVVLLGIPRLLGAHPLAVVARWRAAQVEQVLRGVADRYERVFLVQADPVAMRELRTVAGSAVYRATAERILPAALEAMGIPLTATTEPDGDPTSDADCGRMAP